MSDEKMGVVVNLETIKEHLKRVKDAEEYFAKFGKGADYLNSLHEQSSKYLAAMQDEMVRNRQAMNIYNQATRALERIR